MRADGGVEAVVGDDEALDGTAGDEVLADYFRHVFNGDTAVPDGLGVYDDGGAMFALVEASGLIGADGAAEAGSPDSVLEGRVKFAFAVAGTGRAGAARFTDVGADEDMAFEFRQSGKLLLGWDLF